MQQLPRVVFRQNLTAALSQLPMATPMGQVLAQTRKVELGSPAGTHGAVDCWEYRQGGFACKMWFGFYKNFTPDDLICKVINDGRQLEPGEGASVQFNADLCVSSNGLVLSHHGNITVVHRVKRKVLENQIALLVPGEWNLLGHELGRWPVSIGTTVAPGTLIDRLYSYSYCVEQAKRSLKGQKLLPP